MTRLCVPSVTLKWLIDRGCLCACAIVIGWIGHCSEKHARAQGFSPDKAAAQMTVAEGLVVELFAAEPLVRQPVTIDFDDRGRLWVIQYLQYPNPAGLKRAKVDRYSRTTYDRMPEPPPHGPRGADRVTILEDTDGDGRADQSKDFVDGLNLATGLAFGHGGVFVLNAPYLLFYPDQNRDDIPDSDPQVLLTGFGIEDASSVANSLLWGPDGWLYGCQGSTVTANIRDTEFQQGVWRYHPDTRRFELFCEGGGNLWGLDYDRKGNLMASTNVGGFVMLHALPGAYYWKSFGKHGPLHNPFAFGFFQHVPHENFQGGHVTTGGRFYSGTSLPDKYRNQYVAGDLLGHAVNWHRVDRSGATFVSAHGGQMLLANDSWFAPDDVTIGPDGAIYIADWHDRRTAHPDPDADWDKSSGRIYRLQAKKARRAAQRDVRDATTDQLFEWLGSRNGWYVRRARRVLAARCDAEIAARLRQLALQNRDEQLALEALWTLATRGDFDETLGRKLLEYHDADVRRWAVRLLGQLDRLTPAAVQALIELAESEPIAAVSAALASAARRLPAPDGIAIAAKLALRSEFAEDPVVPLMLWWSVEQHAIPDIDNVLGHFAVPAAWASPLAAESILPRLMRRYAAGGTERGLDACAQLLGSAPGASQRRLLFEQLNQGLQIDTSAARAAPMRGTLFQQFAAPETAASAARSDVVSIPVMLARQLSADGDGAATDPLLVAIRARLGDPAAREQALAVALDSAAPTADRRQMLELLGQLADARFVEPVLELVGAGQPDSIQQAALTVLGRFPHARIGAAVTAAYAHMSPEVKRRARQLLSSRKEWAKRFLEEFERKTYDRAEVRIDELRLMASHADDALDEQVRRIWGSVRAGTPEEKLAEMRRLNNDVRAGNGDIQRGRALFEKQCAACHRLFGQGGQTGPDLTHANRQDRDFLLRSLVDPSAQIRREYLSYVVQLRDGRVLTGMIAEETPADWTLVDANNKRMTIRRSDVVRTVESTTSLMPDNLYQQLTPQQLRDLFSYLQQ